MGVVLTFYVPHHEAALEPAEYGWDVRHHTRLRMACKHYEMGAVLWARAEFVEDTRYHIEREKAAGHVPAGVLAAVLDDYFRGWKPHPDEVAALAYIRALPPDRPIVVQRT